MPLQSKFKTSTSLENLPEKEESCSYHRSTRRTRVGKNAARERTRVQLLKKAFGDLQKVLPDVPENTKLSRLDILLLAINYMSHLMSVLSEVDKCDKLETEESSKRKVRFRPSLYKHHVLNCFLR